MSTPPESAAVAPSESTGHRRDAAGGMVFLDTSGSTRLPALMEMVAALSRAKEPKEVLQAFAQGLQKIYDDKGYVSLSTRGLEPGEYKITRLITEDVPGTIGDADPWRARFGELALEVVEERESDLAARRPVVVSEVQRLGDRVAITLLEPLRQLPRRLPRFG